MNQKDRLDQLQSIDNSLLVVMNKLGNIAEHNSDGALLAALESDLRALREDVREMWTQEIHGS